MWQLRDGRALRQDCKPKVVLSINRWLSKTAGFQGRTQDASLRELGLEDVVPSHCHRPPCPWYFSEVPVGMLPARHECPASDSRLASDYAFRFIRKGALAIHEAVHASVFLMPFAALPCLPGNGEATISIHFCTLRCIS